MTATKPKKQEKRLGGGLVLLPSNAGISSSQRFGLQQPYSLGEKAFFVEPGLIADAMDLLNLRRMENITQLQCISTVQVDKRRMGGRGSHIFAHNRLIHNLRSGALHGIMGQTCNFDAMTLAIGILADCMHDNFTCAGGDSWKDNRHQGTLFDEDDAFGEKIFRYYGDGWRRLCAKYGFNSQMTAHMSVQSIIEGRGVSGEIHEIADTASYMMGDLEQIKLVEHNYSNTKDFAEILSVAKYPWDIWDSIVEKDGHIVVTDPLALNNFLLLRILLWKNLYQNPGRKVLELLMMKIVYPYLVKRKILKISDLPTHGDSWLFDMVEHEMGWASGMSKDLTLLGSFPKLQAFATWKEALEFEEKKIQNSGAFTLVFSVEEFQKTSSKTDKYLVFTPDGQVDTFKSVYPKHAAVIDGLAKASTSLDLPVYVVYVLHPQISNNLRKAWQEARAKWRKRK